MTIPPPDTNSSANPREPRNIVIFSDGTGQRGGLYFDEVRTNVYKLFRATRVGPDSSIDPDKQVAFYDPGLGTLPAGGTTIERAYRYIYNYISQATGLGITRNIIDCYAAIIRLWQPGDRIFLFGFSRGAYTVRCLAAVICKCGIPTQEKDGRPLRRDVGSTAKIAARAVKSVYQHVSSPRDQKYVGQRSDLARRFRQRYKAGDPGGKDEPNVYPHFIGVFDTVAALSNTGSLGMLWLVYAFLHIALAGALAVFTDEAFGYWFGWISVWTVCAIATAYIYTHLKFAFALKDYYFWDVIHLTSFRQKFYDQYLDRHVKYARHAISLDERRADFRRVKWGRRDKAYPDTAYRIDDFQQIWFAGNHADIGGGYPENESRLSDIALAWMIEQVSDPRLAEEALIVDGSVLRPNGRADGMQHDEVQGSIFRFAKKTIRDAPKDAPLHLTVKDRVDLAAVQQYDIMAPYRPEALRCNEKFASLYSNIPLPHVTAWQRIEATLSNAVHATGDRLTKMAGTKLRPLYPNGWTGDATMEQKPQLTADSIVSLIALLCLIGFAGYAVRIFLFWQIIPWLQEAYWHSYPISDFMSADVTWKGLRIIVDWVLKLPAALVFALIGVFVFWFLGLVSTWMYKAAASKAGKVLTPSQTHA